ncbi:MAG: nuclear transport factor 2 family protein, partial [Mycobacteriales bacterium]
MSWELSQLVHRYALAIDSRQSVVPLFTADGALVVPDPPQVLDPVIEHVGPAAIAAATSGLPRTFHAIVGEVFSTGADGARGRIACVAHHVVDAQTDL